MLTILWEKAKQKKEHGITVPYYNSWMNQFLAVFNHCFIIIIIIIIIIVIIIIIIIIISPLFFVFVLIKKKDTSLFISWSRVRVCRIRETPLSCS